MPLTKEQLIKLGELHKEIASIYLSVATEETKEVVAEVEEVETNEEVVEESTEEVEESNDEIQEGKDAVDLEGMSYNDLKKLAKELNLSAKGTKSELVDRIKEAQGILVVDEEAEDEEVEIEEPVEEVEEVEEELETSLHDKVASDLEDYTDEELKDILESIDKPTKGKRQTLIALIVQAIEDGELDFGDEEEEEVEEDNDETNDEVDEVSDETEDEEELDLEDILSDLDRDQIKAICRKLDIKVMKKDTAETLATKVMEYEDENSLLDVLIDLGYVSLEDETEDEEEDEVEEIQEPNFIGSKERVKAMKKVYAETLEDIEEGTIKAKDVTKFLKEYHNDTWQGTQDENNKEYARIKAELVDNEGDSVSLEEAYYVGDDVYCCGAKLKELDGDYYCEFCGTEYEA